MVRSAWMLLILFNFFYVKANSQDQDRPQRLVFYFLSKEDFLTNHIEKSLAQLRSTSTTKQLFKAITNLNRIDQNSSAEVNLQKFAKLYSYNPETSTSSIKVSEYSDETKRLYSAIASQLGNNDLFLLIKTNIISDLIEYQFTLFRFNSQDSALNTFLRTTNPLEPFATQDIFVDPRSDHYLIDVENALKRLFPSSNSAPRAIISPAAQVAIQHGQYYARVFDTIKLMSTKSYDLDTKKSDWKYTWRQIGENGEINISDSIRLNMMQYADAVSIIPDKAGVYMVGLTISDGIASSKEDTFKFTAVILENIYLSTHNIVQNNQGGLFRIFNKPQSGVLMFTANKGDYETHVEYENPSLIDQDLHAEYKQLKQFITNDAKYHNHSRIHLKTHQYYGLGSMEKVDSMPNVVELLKRKAQAPPYETKRIEGGVEISIGEIPAFTSRSYKVFLTKNGLGTPVERLSVTNVAKNRLVTFYAGAGYINAALPNPNNINDTLSISGLSFPVGGQVFLTGQWGIGVEHSITNVVPKQILQLSPKERLSFTTINMFYQRPVKKILKVNSIYSLGVGWFSSGTQKLNTSRYRYILLASIFEFPIFSAVSIGLKPEIGLPIKTFVRPFWNLGLSLRINPLLSNLVK